MAEATDITQGRRSPSPARPATQGNTRQSAFDAYKNTGIDLANDEEAQLRELVRLRQIQQLN